MSLIVKSKEQLAGDIIRALIALSDISDVAEGSSTAILIESIASVMFQIQIKIMKILESSNIESLVGVALDNKAKSLGLPNGIGGLGRIPATKSSGNVTVGSSFVKISTKPYAGKPSPYAGSTLLYLENASSFPSTGSLYLGRGTADRFEGPIPYTSVTNNVSYWTVVLSQPMTKSHLTSDLITLSQGGNRTINVGTTGITVAAEGKPSVSFSSLASVLLPDGESSVSVQVTCTQFGEVGNALAGAISQFATAPFTGATITNPTSFANGHSSENDADLRKRIKNFPDYLARGTSNAIVAAIQGAVDPSTGHAILSSAVDEAVVAGEATVVYIDDGTGLEPTFNPQPYELLLESALGVESNVELAQVPVTPCLAVGVVQGPYILADGSQSSIPIDRLEVVIDGFLETYPINPSNYVSLNAATTYEIVRDFNSQVTNALQTGNSRTEWRTINGGKNIICFAKNGNAGSMSFNSTPLLEKLGLPLGVRKPLFLYEDGKLLSNTGTTAQIISAPQSEWLASISALAPTFSFNAEMQIGQVTMSVTIDNTDFQPFGTTMLNATLDNWVSVFKTKFAGISYRIVSNTIVFTSQDADSDESILKIADGDPVWVGGPGTVGIMDSAKIVQLNQGSSQDYYFNRMTGEIQFINNPAVGSKIEAGTRSTRAFVVSTTTLTGLYSFSDMNPGVGYSKMVVTFDDPTAQAYMTPSMTSTDTVTISNRGLNAVTLTFSNSTFFIELVGEGVTVGDCFLLTMDTTVGASWGDVEGIYRIKVLGTSTNYSITFEVSPDQYAAFSALFGQSQFINPNMFKFFRSSYTVPQLVTITGTGAVSIDSLVASINSQVFGGSAEKLNATKFAIRSNRFDERSYCSILALSGSIGAILQTTNATGIQSHVAFSESQVAGGASPVVGAISVAGSYASGRASRSYLRTDKILTDILDPSAVPVTISDFQAAASKYPKGCEHLWITGQNAMFEGRCYNTGTSGGFSGIMSSAGTIPLIETTSQQAAVLPATDGTTLDEYRNFGIRVQDLGVASDDKLVVVLDQDSSDKTVMVAMGKKAVIQDMAVIASDGQPQTIHFRLQDPDDSNLPFFDTSSIFKTFDFSDFNMLTKSVGIVKNFNGFADIPRANLGFLPYDTVSGLQAYDEVLLNDGFGTQAEFKLMNISDVVSINWSSGSPNLVSGALTPALNSVITLSYMGGDTIPSNISQNSVWYVVSSGITPFQVSSSIGGTPVSMIGVGGHFSAVIQSPSVIPVVSIVLPYFAKSIGSVQTLPSVSPAPAVIAITSFAALGTSVTTSYNHGFAIGDAVTFSTTGSLPSNIFVGITYWVLTSSTNVFTISASYNGSAITFATAGTGPWTCTTVGILDADTVTLNDGTHNAVTFEFDSNSSYAPTNIRVPFSKGTQATGAVTVASTIYSSSNVNFTASVTSYANGMCVITSATNWATVIPAGSYLIFNTSNWYLYDSVAPNDVWYVVSSSFNGTNTTTFVVRPSYYGAALSGAGSTTTNVYTSVQVMDLYNASHDDIFTISDGVTSNQYEIWLRVSTLYPYATYGNPSASVTPVYVDPTTFFGIIAMSPVVMSTALNNTINTKLGTNLAGLVSSTTSPTSPSSIINLTNQRYRASGNVAITVIRTPALKNYALAPTYVIAGMSGGADPTSAAGIASALQVSIAGLSSSTLAITAVVLDRTVSLTNQNYGAAGNRHILSTNARVILSGMSGGVNAPSATDMRDLFLGAIDSFIALGTMNLEAIDSGTTAIDLLGTLVGVYTISSIQSVASTAVLPFTSTTGTVVPSFTSNALVVRSVKFGCPSRIAVSIQYPVLPNQSTILVNHTNLFDADSNSPSQLCTFTAPSTVNCASHGLKIGDRVFFVSSVSLPVGLNEDQIYYVLTVPTTGTFTVTASSIDSSLASAVIFTGSGSGTISFIKVNDEFAARTILDISLKSGAAVGGALVNTGTYIVTSRIVDQYTRRLIFTSSSLNQTLVYAVGNVLTVGGSVDISGSYLISFADVGYVEVIAPGSSRSISSTYQAALAPINTFPIVNTSISDVATAINGYLPDNPIATAVAIGTGTTSEYITNATYISNVMEYQGFDADMADSLNNHAFNCKLAGIANIYQYITTDPSTNNIVALVQSHDSLFPNFTDVGGLNYSFIGEEVYLVPSNKVTASRWLNFVVSSSLSILADIENVGYNGSDVQIASLSDGSFGAVQVLDSGANQASTFVIGNGSDLDDSTKVFVLSSAADRFVRDNLVMVQNTLSSEIVRSYAQVWQGNGIAPAAEARSINEYFRPTTTVKYEQVTSSTARLYFYRNDMTAVVPPLSTGTVVITKVDVGLYDLSITAGSGTFSARSGDICLFGPGSAFPSTWKYASAQAVGSTAANPVGCVYPGHQVVAVISNTEILIAAIDDLSPYSGPVTVSVANSYDITFAPAIWNEKNIYTNMRGGTEFSTTNSYNNGEAWLETTKIGDNFVSVWLKNSATELSDDMKLASALVSTDDFVYLTPYDTTPSRLVSHNGRNHLIVYDPTLDSSLPMDGTTRGTEIGSNYWMNQYYRPAVVFTLTAPASIMAGTIYTNNGSTFVVTATTSSSTSLAASSFNGTASSSGTLTFVSGSPSGNLSFSSVTTSIYDPRAIRIIDSNSVKVGDNLRISSSVVTGATWFGTTMLGSWPVLEIGWSQRVQGKLVLAMPGSTPADASSFQLTDGYAGDTPLTFEFNSVQSNVTSGHIWISTFGLTGGSYNQLTMGQRIAAAINLVKNQMFFLASVTTGSVGEVTLINAVIGNANDSGNMGMGASYSSSCSLSVTLNTLNQASTNDPTLMCPTILIQVPNCPRYIYDSTNTPVSTFVLSNNVGSLGFTEGTPLSAFRVIGGQALDPLNEEQSELFLAPQRQSNKMSSSYGTQLIAMNKFGFSNEINVGIAGYTVFSGLIQQAHKIIDGSIADPVTYPGVRASGTQIEVLPPLIKSIQVNLIVITKEGISLGSLTETIKTAVASYVNSLGAGDPVILSDIISVVQSIAGVASVRFPPTNGTSPAVDVNNLGQITTSSNERAYILNASTDITVG